MTSVGYTKNPIRGPSTPLRFAQEDNAKKVAHRDDPPCWIERWTFNVGAIRLALRAGCWTFLYKRNLDPALRLIPPRPPFLVPQKSPRSSLAPHYRPLRHPRF